ncbi:MULTISPECIES: hypothetical protein [Agrobacterium]|nr:MULTISPECIES: hypothetical protein [Agrobacterium]MDH0873829.1 hypothetical protein [Agrobacterium pusense]
MRKGFPGLSLMVQETLKPSSLPPGLRPMPCSSRSGFH